MLRRFSSGAHKKITRDIAALVVPHAGYLYSGQTAAWAYKQIEGANYERVIILAPSHYAYFPGVSIFDGSAYDTPLGQIELDNQTITRLKKKHAWIDYYDEAETQEHSIEAQLPFLQYFLKTFRIIPILMHDQGYETCTRLAAALEKEITSSRTPTLVVASSDLYHGPGAERAREASKRTAECIKKMDPKAFHAAIGEGKCQACGYGAVATAMLLAAHFGAGSAEILHLTTSYDVYPAGDAYVAGYLSAAMFK